MTEIVAGRRYSRSPEECAAEIEADEAQGRETAGTDNDRSDGPHAVDETVGEDGNYLVVNEKVTNPVCTGLPPGSALQISLPLPFPDLKEELVSGECPDKSRQHDPWQIEMPAVRQETGDNDDGLPFHQGPDEECRVTVTCDKSFKG